MPAVEGSNDVTATDFLQQQKSNLELSSLGANEPSSSVVSSGEESIPLAALLSSAPINESDILPPSILQSMNFWLNDSLLTGSSNNNSSVVSSQQLPLQVNVNVPHKVATDTDKLPTPVPLSVTPVPTSFPLPHPQTQQQPPSLPSSLTMPQPQQHSFSGLGDLIPMDLALDLPNLATTNSFKDIGNMGSLAPVQQIGNHQPGLAPDFLQQLSQQLHPFRQGSIDSSTNSPLTVSSPNPLSMMPFPTTDFASLNLLNPFDTQQQQQQQQQHLSTMTATSVSSSGILRDANIPPALAGISEGAYGNVFANVSTQTSNSTPGNSATQQPVPGSLSNASTMESLNNANMLPQTLSFCSGGLAAALTQNGGSNKKDSDVFQKATTENQGSMLGSIAFAEGDSNNAVLDPLVMLSTSNSSMSTKLNWDTSQLFSQLTATPVQKQSPTISTDASGPPLSLSDLQMNGNSPSLNLRNGGISSPNGSTSSSAVVAQMNNDAIPQMLKDTVSLHPELGSAELIYNLLITHVVHDWSRIGIYQAHLFWMRIKQYKLPKFHLFAMIADASRSWTLAEELRSALPPNLDEICYSLAIKDTPTEAAKPNILTCLGLIALAGYEFKSARFAPMLEHGCLAYRLITLIKFRGASFPWRAVKKCYDIDGLDSNYQLLLRAFWRIYMSLFYATEIFRLDAPEDRDFLPEMPVCDDIFVQHVFVSDISQEFGFKMVKPPYTVSDTGHGDLFRILCELYIRQYKISNKFNRVLRGEKSSMFYLTFLREWDRQMLEWREKLPAYLKDDLVELSRTTKPLDARQRKMNFNGLSEDEMWQKRHAWNQEVGRAMEILYVHMMFDSLRLKAHRIGLIILMHEDLEMVRNFQHSRVFAVSEIPIEPSREPIMGSHAEDSAWFKELMESANETASHLYTLLKFNHQFGFDLHAYTVVIVGTLLQLGLVYVGQVQSQDSQVAWQAMLRLARILGMIRSLDRWGPALYIFTNILKALGRSDLIMRLPSPETRARLVADTRKPTSTGSRSMSVDSDGSANQNKRKNEDSNMHGDEKRYEFSDQHHGDPHSVTNSLDSPNSMNEDEFVANPFPPDHVISHIMKEQNVSTATFFSPTLPILAASLLHSNT